jgi:predicted O-methyltransferase YrrM
MMMYNLKDNWFRKAAPDWERLFVKRDSHWTSKWDLENKPINVLEIGVWEGSSTTWILDNLIVNPCSGLSCIDTFEGSPEHSWKETTEANFRFNENIALSGKEAQIDIHEGSSQHMLPHLIEIGESEYYDIIYIDGSHNHEDVLFDAVVGFTLLAPGGVIVFDDYTWDIRANNGAVVYSPRLAIDAFYGIMRDKLEMITKFKNGDRMSNCHHFLGKR